MDEIDDKENLATSKTLHGPESRCHHQGHPLNRALYGEGNTCRSSSTRSTGGCGQTTSFSGNFPTMRLPVEDQGLGGLHARQESQEDLLFDGQRTSAINDGTLHGARVSLWKIMEDLRSWRFMEDENGKPRTNSQILQLRIQEVCDHPSFHKLEAINTSYARLASPATRSWRLPSARIGRRRFGGEQGGNV